MELDSGERVVQAQRVILWEEVKGKLNALRGLHGFGPERAWNYAERTARYDALAMKIGLFIEDIENNGLHE